MLTANLKQIFVQAFHTVRRSKTLQYWRRVLSPSALVVEVRCARRIDALSKRLAGMRAKIAALSAHLLSGRMDKAIDADASLRRMLAELKHDLNVIRRDLAIWHARECRGRTGARLAASIAQLNRIAADTYAAADRLEWEIEAHDSGYAR
jgi:hypothetical protein